jgi:hypothetical protein
VDSFSQVYPLKPCMHFYSLPYVLHAPPTLAFLTSSREWYFVRSREQFFFNAIKNLPLYSWAKFPVTRTDSLRRRKISPVVNNFDYVNWCTPEGRRPLGRPRRRWEDNIKMDLREVGWGGMDWINLAQDRDRCRALVNAVMNLRVP